MKKSEFILIFFILLTSKFKAQEFIQVNPADSLKVSIKDTLTKRNEFGLNLLPMMNVVSASNPGPHSRLTLSYRRFSKANVFRISFSLLPYADQYPVNRGKEFYLLKDTFLIMRTSENTSDPKYQLNIGYEKVLSNERLVQSFGFEGSLFYQDKSLREDYSWIGKTSYEPYNSYSGPNAGAVDTLGYRSSIKTYGLGVHLFYNVRLPLSKRWSLSATMGPQFYYGRSEDEVFTIKTQTSATYNAVFLDVTPLLLSDLSICYRF